MCKQYARKSESRYIVSPYIAEFWNSISNFPFMIIALIRLSEDPSVQIKLLYLNLFWIGVGSAIHHSITMKYSMVIDYIPIIYTTCYFLSNSYYECLTYTTIFKLALSFAVLLVDHIWTIVPVPWGQVGWHLLASFSLDDVIQDVRYNF